MKYLALNLLLAAILINAQTLLAQGPLQPSGAPAPSMKTLDQIEPRVPISTEDLSTPGTHFEITQSGVYYFTENITSPDGGGQIEILADNVTIDLNGFTYTIINNSSAITVFGFDNAIIKNGRMVSTTNNGTAVNVLTIAGSVVVEDISINGFYFGLRGVKDGDTIRNISIKDTDHPVQGFEFSTVGNSYDIPEPLLIDGLSIYQTSGTGHPLNLRGNSNDQHKVIIKDTVVSGDETDVISELNDLNVEIENSSIPKSLINSASNNDYKIRIKDSSIAQLETLSKTTITNSSVSQIKASQVVLDRSRVINGGIGTDLHGSYQISNTVFTNSGVWSNGHVILSNSSFNVTSESELAVNLLSLSIPYGTNTLIYADSISASSTQFIFDLYNGQSASTTLKAIELGGSPAPVVSEVKSSLFSSGFITAIDGREQQVNVDGCTFTGTSHHNDTALWIVEGSAIRNSTFKDYLHAILMENLAGETSITLIENCSIDGLEQNGDTGILSKRMQVVNTTITDVDEAILVNSDGYMVGNDLTIINSSPYFINAGYANQIDLNNCTFTTSPSGGTAPQMIILPKTSTIVNCVFTNFNTALYGPGGLEMSLEVRDSIFQHGNTAVVSASTILKDSSFKNVSLAMNVSGEYGSITDNVFYGSPANVFIQLAQGTIDNNRGANTFDISDSGAVVVTRNQAYTLSTGASNILAPIITPAQVPTNTNPNVNIDL